MGFSDTLGFKQNNVFNIRGDGIPYLGKTGMKNGFSVFSDRIYGIRAVYKDMIYKTSHGVDTISKIINMYAPPSENNTKKYIDFIVKKTGIGKDSKINGLPLIRKIIKAIAIFETGYLVTDEEAIVAESMINDKKKIVFTDDKKINILLLFFLLAMFAAIILI